jgi:hypothetical protein
MWFAILFRLGIGVTSDVGVHLIINVCIILVRGWITL